MLCSPTHLNSAMSVRKRLRIKFARFRKKPGTREVDRVTLSRSILVLQLRKIELSRRKESKNGKLNDERANNIRTLVGRTGDDHRARSTAGRTCECNGITTDRVCSWALAAAEQLGPLGDCV